MLGRQATALPGAASRRWLTWPNRGDVDRSANGRPNPRNPLIRSRGQDAPPGRGECRVARDKFAMGSGRKAKLPLTIGSERPKQRAGPRWRNW